MEQKNTLPRIGTFFIIIGAASTFLFIISDIAETVSFDYLFLGFLFIGIGFFMRRKTEKPVSSGRFSSWKKMWGKDDDEKGR